MVTDLSQQYKNLVRRLFERITFTGTHEGEFMGIAPTSRKVVYAVIDIVRIANGNIVEHWAVSDDLGLMRQLGINTMGMKHYLNFNAL